MSDFANGNPDGGFIFISHAHKDIHEIRKIRNTLEENGLEPICFYLRCLSDDDEVLDLIKREIDAREWFLLVDSKNARQSNWVKTEVEYIKSKDVKKMISISLDEQSDILPMLNRVSNSMRVFLSYSIKDMQIAEAIYNGCIKRDFKVFYDAESVPVGANMIESFYGALKEATEHGCVVHIVSENSIHAGLVNAEVRVAASEGAYILPVLVDDVELPEQLLQSLASTQFYRLKTPISEEQVSEIVERIEELALKRLNDTTK